MKYYYIDDIEAVAKADNEAQYLYDRDKGWVKDLHSIVMDFMVGWEDPDDEPPGSPFGGFGHLSVMRHLREITEEKMNSYISDPAYQYTYE